MAPALDEPNVEFNGPALRYYNSQNGLVQADLAAIAAGLYSQPFIDGETKYMVPVRQDAGVSVYERAYIGERYWMYYDYDDESEPPLLTIKACGLIDELSN